jgi:hypothetical protein
VRGEGEKGVRYLGPWKWGGSGAGFLSDVGERGTP